MILRHSTITAEPRRAVKLLKKHGDEAKVLSGHEPAPDAQVALGFVAHLVDINRIPGLDYIKEKGETLHRAMTRQAALERSDHDPDKYPILADAIPLIADPLVRNRRNDRRKRGHGRSRQRPAGDHAGLAPPSSRRAGRSAPYREPFYKGLYSTALAPNEILTEIAFPRRRAKRRGYAKLKRKTATSRWRPRRCS